MAKGVKTGGRQAGTPNKTTATMKAAIMTVYDRLQEGREEPHGHFLAWAQEEPTEFYRLASKLIPLQMSSDPENPMPTGFTVMLVKNDQTAD